MTSSKLLSTTFVLLLVATLVRQAAADCESVKIPRNLCRACRMRTHNEFGIFPGSNQRDMYRLELPWCKIVMRSYIKQNPCDDYLSESYNNIDKGDNYNRVVYWLYSVCEFCCDCIPIGAKPEEYTTRKNSNRLIALNRGNCPAHYVYDICAIWPSIGHVTNKAGTSRLGLPEVCPDMRKWLNSPDANGWLENPRVDGVTDLMRKGMNQLARYANCRDERVWKDCTRFERAQGRV